MRTSALHGNKNLLLIRSFTMHYFQTLQQYAFGVDPKRILDNNSCSDTPWRYNISEHYFEARNALQKKKNQSHRQDFSDILNVMITTNPPKNKINVKIYFQLCLCTKLKVTRLTIFHPSGNGVHLKNLKTVIIIFQDIGYKIYDDSLRLVRQQWQNNMINVRQI